MKTKHIILDEIESTNSYAKTLNDYHKNTLTIIRAKKQTGGRGRLEKKFFSNHDGGLWVTLVAPIENIEKHFTHNRAISLAIVQTLKKNCAANNNIKIKWSNDIYWDNEKIAGILLENIPHDKNFIIVGFGLNVNMRIDDFPEELRDAVGSVYIKTGELEDLDILLGEIVSRYLKNLSDESAHEKYLSLLYKKKSAAKINGCVGIFDGVEPDGRLRLKINESGYKFFTTGTLEF